MSSRPPGDSAELTAAASPGAGPSGPTSISGTSIGHFEVLELLGRGGFGEVYRARDARLGRMVALKVLPEAFGQDAERRERFRREAMAASALNHPNICTVYELIETADRNVIVMELVEGQTLHAALAKGPLPVTETLSIGIQAVDALGEAHRAGILHRDVKSGNIMLTARGQVKVLDFGLAKRLDPGEGSGGSEPERLTREGTTLGTLSYMSPEQLLGRPVDTRSDLFSLGVVLYEMATGRLPFEGSTPVAVSDAILHAPPRDFGDAPGPEALKAVVRKLLEKDPGRRFANAEEVREALRAIQGAMAPARAPGLSRNARILLAAAAVVAVAGGGWAWHRARRARWAREVATPEVARLVAAEEFPKAVLLAREARAVLPNDPTLENLFLQATMEATVESVPPGADVSIRPYRGDPDRWESLGQAPLSKIRVPRDYYVWRISKPGFAPAYEIAPTWSIVHRLPMNLTFRLDAEGSIPPGMVRIPGGKIGLAIPGLDQLPEVPLDDYLIDRTEVTNEEFRKFVDAGGYAKREYWKEPFVRDGQAVPWEEAVARFRDATGRPGPATWELGTFPKGMEKHPVAGVSWFEAAAYAAYAGKSLPTIYHWNRAAQTQASLLVSPGSNFQGNGTLPAGGAGTFSGYGTFDMAGNVKEWCRNEGPGGKRYILGGGFGEPTYMFIDPDTQSPWDRRPNYGLRCVSLAGSPPAAALVKTEIAFRDFSKEKPVSDEVFRAFKGLYAYDKGELDARVEATETTEEWTHETVSFRAAYGGERVFAHLYLPKNAAPPYQTVVYFPGSGAISADRFVLSPYADFIPKGGRALLAPIYKSTFERRDDLKNDVSNQTAFWRDHVIMWSKDLGRSLDYLESRPDIDRSKLAYLGLSWGSALAPNLLAVEDRFRVAILESGGLLFQRSLPEADAINFVTRVRIPVLMLNGRYDHFFPVESSQLPLYRLLGAPEKDKRHVIYETGHAPPRKEFIRESLDWLDRYLGAVKP
ncbi:MAG TPA: protein kinase [Thermoanaerobaculia bacterium]|nr:protein kinase [Thermoanaerobaculia bacterium]HQR66084.1 protein kinase [Thermoanaerobaculia bacterium]